MNKRADEEASPRTGIIAAVISAVVLVIIVMALIYFFYGGGGKFWSYLPGFNDQKPLVVQGEVIRYNVGLDNLQFYDGTAWQNFPKDGKSPDFNGKRIANEKGIEDSSSLLAALRLYTSINGRPVIEGFSFCMVEETRTQKGVPVVNWIWTKIAGESYVYNLEGGDCEATATGDLAISRGDLIISYSNKDYLFESRNSNIFELDFEEGSLGIKDYNDKIVISDNSLKALLTEKASIWNNHYLAFPVTVNYLDRNSKLYTEQHCVTKKSDSKTSVSYVVDLTDEVVTKETKCNV